VSGTEVEEVKLMNAPLTAKDFATSKLAVIALMMVATPCVADASNQMCFSDEKISSVSLKGGLRPANHPWNEEPAKQSRTIYTFDPKLPQLLEVLERLNSNWGTPESLWSEDAIIVNFKGNGPVVCQIVYSRTELFAQNNPSSAFLVRPLYEFEAKQINDALFNKSTAVR
jgi:hypothetical protein